MIENLSDFELNNVAGGGCYCDCVIYGIDWVNQGYYDNDEECEAACIAVYGSVYSDYSC